MEYLISTISGNLSGNMGKYATKLNPRKAAAQIVAAHSNQTDWLNQFAEHLDRARAGQSLSRTLDVWDLNQSQAATLFGVSRQALSKWIIQGVPADRAVAVADLAAATDLLVHYLKRDRISGVVRRSIPALKGRSLLDLFAADKTDELLQSCQLMFDFSQA